MSPATRHGDAVVDFMLIKRTRSINDAPQNQVAERVRYGIDRGQRRSAGIFQGSRVS